MYLTARRQEKEQRGNYARYDRINENRKSAVNCSAVFGLGIFAQDIQNKQTGIIYHTFSSRLL